MDVVGDVGTRVPLTEAETRALGVVGLALVGFGVHGVVHGVPGTVEYLVTVVVLIAVIFRLRKEAISGPLAGAMAVVAIVHLSGGLIRIGDDVLYNASPGVELFRYDHFAHALGIFFGTQLLWELLVRDAVQPARRGHLVVISALAGLGLGAVNETIEFLATLAHGGGSHVGGYKNTGWDLVANLVAGVSAGLVLHQRQES
jgi:uncharacterized membrane protein YjdF